MRIAKCLMAAALVTCASPAVAQDASGLATAAHNLGITEVRGGLMIDDVELFSHAPIWAIPHFDTIKAENLDTASFDVLFRSPFPDSFWWLGAPRPVVGFDLNYKHESEIHASLNWHLPIGHTGLFVEGEFGGAIHNGNLVNPVAPMRDLGCRALFYWSANIGYEFNDQWSIMATEQHASQDGLCGWVHNQGINYEGVRIGYKF